MFNILITGGAGFLGSHIARELDRVENKVVILDDLSGGFTENLPENVIFVKGSVTDHVLLEQLFLNYQFDYVFHLAAYAAENLSHFIKRFNYTNNLIGSVNLINESVKHKVKCFVFTSSVAVYGENHLPYSEYQQPHPVDSYGIAKFAVEMELQRSCEMFGLPYIIFRPHNIYGENQNIGDKYRNVLGIFINQLLQDQPLTIFGDGSQKRQFSYVRDIAPIIANSIFNKKFYRDIFNIGSDTYYTVRDIAATVCQAFGCKYSVKFLEERHEVHSAIASHFELNDLAPINETPILVGITRMIEWAKKAGARKSVPFGNIEITRGLPEGWS